MNAIRITKLSAVALTVLATHLAVFAGGHEDQGYVAHEWGTFTSVQGADGVAQPWHPLVTSELPSFVYDRSGGTECGKDISLFFGAGKSAFTALQRMETPVIYFYSDRERTVSASVLFPKGQITEWYPVATGPAAAAGDLASLRNGHLRWENFKVLSADAAHRFAELPRDGRGSHYYAARDTDANLVQVRSGQETILQTEKFLFYRGVGWFTTPLHVTMAEDESSLKLGNHGPAPLTQLFVIEIHQGKARFQHVPRLEPNQTLRVAIDGKAGEANRITPDVASALRDALTADGLYPREAAAMVATWNESWFSEDGLRVLYLLPRTWTDAILPLELNPKPAQMVRTMVGRAEVIKPSVERLLAEKIRSFGTATEESREEVAAQTRALGLGRFLEPAMRRVQARSQSEEFHRWAAELLESAGKPVPAAELAQGSATVAR